MLRNSHEQYSCVVLDAAMRTQLAFRSRGALEEMYGTIVMSGKSGHVLFAHAERHKYGLPSSMFDSKRSGGQSQQVVGVRTQQQDALALGGLLYAMYHNSTSTPPHPPYPALGVGLPSAHLHVQKVDPFEEEEEEKGPLLVAVVLPKEARFAGKRIVGSLADAFVAQGVAKRGALPWARWATKKAAWFERWRGVGLVDAYLAVGLERSGLSWVWIHSSRSHRVSQPSKDRNGGVVWGGVGRGGVGEEEEELFAIHPLPPLMTSVAVVDRASSSSESAGCWGWTCCFLSTSGDDDAGDDDGGNDHGDEHGDEHDDEHGRVTTLFYTSKDPEQTDMHFALIDTGLRRQLEDLQHLTHTPRLDGTTDHVQVDVYVSLPSLLSPPSPTPAPDEPASHAQVVVQRCDPDTLIGIPHATPSPTQAMLSLYPYILLAYDHLHTSSRTLVRL